MLLGDGAFRLRVVGTSYHQEALEKIAGAPTGAGFHQYCAALLVPQPTNRYDRHAIVVIVSDLEVAHLERDHARELGRTLRTSGYSDAICEAEIVGGRVCGPDDWGYVGLHLNAVRPFRLQSAEEWQAARGRQVAGA